MLDTKKRHGSRLVAILIPLVLAVLLVGAITFATTQFLRADPHASTAAPQWQPYVDAAKKFAVDLMTLSPQTVDRDVQRILDESTGAFHNDFAARHADFVQVTRGSRVTTEATATGAGRESIDGAKADVLVVLTQKVTNNAGAQQDPRYYRLRIEIVKVKDEYKASKVEMLQ